MRSQSALRLVCALGVSSLVRAYEYGDEPVVVWVTETQYVCPCTTAPSYLPTYPSSSASVSTSCSSDSSSYAHSYSVTSSSASPYSVSSSSVSPSTTPSSTTSAHSTTTSTPGETCLPLGADCSNQNAEMGCCASDGLTCDSTTLTCVPVDGTPPGISPTTTTTTTSAPTTTTSTPAETCLPLNADCSNQTADFGCCADSGLTCDSMTLTCVPQN